MTSGGARDGAPLFLWRVSTYPSIVSVELTWRIDEFRTIVDTYFPVDEVWYDGGWPAFTVRVPGDSKERFLRLRRALEPMGYLPLLRRRNGVTVVALTPRPARGRWRWPVNLLLFVATAGTTFFAGYISASALVERGYMTSAVTGGLAFSLSLMGILVTHEMGHKIVSIIRGIDASLPYFIPMAPPVGTMGAVIVTRTPSPNRDALMELGASGPIAGFLIAIPVLIIGIKLSFVRALTTVGGGLFSLPDPVLVQLLTALFQHPADNMVVIMHPVLFAGWIGLLVTSINLLPGGMLDGGHAIRALFGARVHYLLSWVAVAVAAVLGYWPMAILILLLIRRGHPGPLDDISPTSPSRVALGVVLLAVFLLSAVRFPVLGF